MANRRWLPATVLVFAASVATAQESSLRTAQATAFMGTWVIDMTEPAGFKGTHTVGIWDNNGVVAASVQVGKFPANAATGVLKDGNMLVLTISRDAPSAMRENGAPIWSVISLTLAGDTMNAAYMLERSQTIKRGTGK